MTAALLAEVLDWCAEHPHGWHPLPEFGALTMNRYADGSVTVEGDGPEVLGISDALLEAAHSDYLSFADGVLSLTVQHEPLRYRPLGPDPASLMVVFERIREAP